MKGSDLGFFYWCVLGFIGVWGFLVVGGWVGGGGGMGFNFGVFGFFILILASI